MNFDYYPFGMMMVGRKYAAESGYRYGFNGKENDNEVKGEGNQQDYGMRIYDLRLSKFLSVDPLMREYPFYTPYQFASCNPIIAVDIDGLESSKDKNPIVANPVPTKSYITVAGNSRGTYAATIQHNHTEDINTIYNTTTGGDKQFKGNESTIDHMNSNLQPVRPGTIVMNTNNAAHTSLNKAYYSASEKGDEEAWINLFLGGMIRGTVPENIVFSVNGTVSNFMKDGPVYNNLLDQWYDGGMKSNDNRVFESTYDKNAQVGDFFKHLGFDNMSNFAGSAYGTVLANPAANTLDIIITNVTSVHSGDYKKHAKWHNDKPPFLYRDQNISAPQPYTNFSQTFRIQLNLKEAIEDIEVRRLAESMPF